MVSYNPFEENFTFTYYFKYGGVAQLGERLNGIQEVKSSILSVSTKKSRSSERDFFIRCESNGISSPSGVYHHTKCAYHQPQVA